VGGAGTAGGRAKGPVAVAISVACRAAAAACVACGTAAGAGAGRAGAAGGGRKEEGPGRGRSRGRARRRTSRGRKEGRWEVEAKFHALAQEVQRLAQECDEGKRNVALLEGALEREGEGEEAGRLGDNEGLLGELEWGNAVEAPAAAKHRDLEARLATADAGRAVASGALEEGVARLVSLERELREKAARLSGRRRCKRSRILRPPTWCCRSMRGTRSGGGPSPRTSWRGTR
jgi:hypothetical protein